MPITIGSTLLWKCIFLFSSKLSTRKPQPPCSKFGTLSSYHLAVILPFNHTHHHYQMWLICVNKSCIATCAPLKTPSNPDHSLYLAHSLCLLIPLSVCLSVSISLSCPHSEVVFRSLSPPLINLLHEISCAV